MNEATKAVSGCLDREVARTLSPPRPDSSGRLAAPSPNIAAQVHRQRKPGNFFAPGLSFVSALSLNNLLRAGFAFALILLLQAFFAALGAFGGALHQFAANQFEHGRSAPSPLRQPRRTMRV